MKLSHKLIILAAIVTGTFLLQSCDQNNGYYRTFFPEAAPPPFDSTASISDTTLSGGTKIYVLKEGTGPYEVVYRDQLVVRITGRTAKGKIFRTSYSKLEGSTNTGILQNLTSIPARVQQGGYRYTLILLPEGLRKGLLGMKEGEKFIIRVPPSKGFTSPDTYKHGVKVSGKTLIYDIELLRIL